MTATSAWLNENSWTEVYPASERDLTPTEKLMMDIGVLRGDPRAETYGASHEYTGLERVLLRRIEALESQVAQLRGK